MKKLIIGIYLFFLGAINIIALIFIWDTKHRYEVKKTIEKKAQEAREKKANEIKNKPAGQVVNDYLTDTAKTALDDIRDGAVERLKEKSRARADNNNSTGT